MLVTNCFTASVALLALAFALPAPTSKIKALSDLRLIKTSEADFGTWITEEEKISNYKANKIPFIDITDIEDPETLKILCGGDTDISRLAAVRYPTSISHQDEANTLIAKLSTQGPKIWLKTLTNFYNRYYRSSYGTQSSTWLLNQVTSISSSYPAIAVSQFTHSYAQPSIIARIPGSSENLIIVGGHFDSTGGSPNGRGPGADDNGSGVVVILEALRVLAEAQYAPKNSLEFHFYSGEEGGLLGSADIYRSYKSAKKNVLAFVNQDMAGYSPSGKISVYNDYADNALTAYVRLIVSAYVGSSTNDTCGYGCSDHASAYSNGFPAAYVCDEPDATSSLFVHTAEDAYDTVSFDTIARHANFTIAFLVEASYLSDVGQRIGLQGKGWSEWAEGSGAKTTFLYDSSL